MKPSDIFSYAFSAIKLRKLRTALTTLGVVIGIAAIVALLSITQGLQVAVTSQLQRGLATDTLIVTAGGEVGFGNGSGFKLMINDTETLRGIQNVTAAVAVIQRVGYIKSGEAVRRVTIVGVDFEAYQKIYSSVFQAEAGEIPMGSTRDVVVVGKRVSDPYGNGSLFCRAGDTVTLLWTNTTARPLRNETCPVQVAAVLKEVGGFSLGGPSDTSVYIPLEQAERFFGAQECSLIIVKLADDHEATIRSVSNAIREAFSRQVTVTSPTAVLNIVSSVFSTLGLFLAGIAAISLLVAGVGIMNIMIVSLMERTREIGILKALGMRNRTVLLIFLSEAMLIGVMGALIGIAAGWGLSQIVGRVLSMGGNFRIGGQAAAGSIAITPVLTPEVFLGALAFGVLVSVVFALYPAWRASRLNPVEALRYE